MKISYTIIKEFYTIWNTSPHTRLQMRLGQCFFNFIQGHKVYSEPNREILERLYQMDGEEARQVIESLIDYSQ
jgi:hypothetical protein